MPLPPGEEEEKSSEENAEPKLQFSYVECLIFAFHQLAKKVINVYGWHAAYFITDVFPVNRWLLLVLLLMSTTGKFASVHDLLMIII